MSVQVSSQEAVHLLPGVLDTLASICDARYQPIINEMKAVGPYDILPKGYTFHGSTELLGWVFYWMLRTARKQGIN